MLRLIIILACLLVTQPIRAGSPSYLCTTDKATGFYFNGNVWATTDFNDPVEKFIIRKVREGDRYRAGRNEYPYGAFDLGDDSGIGDRCKLGVGIISCEGLVKTHFVVSTGRFLRVYVRGYLWGESDESNKDNPYISIGTCTKI